MTVLTKNRQVSTVVVRPIAIDVMKLHRTARFSTNTAGIANHPPIIMPSENLIPFPVVPAAGGALIMNQFQYANLGSDLFNGAIQ